MRGVGSIALSLPLIAVSLLSAEPAHAVYEMCNPYTIEEFRDQMAAMEKAFEDFDLNEARYQAETAEKQARCITSPVNPEDIGRFARLRAQMYFFDQKTESAAEWMLVSLSAHGARFPEDIGPMHPLRLVLRDIDTMDHEPVTHPGHAVPPKRGAILHNGRLMTKPKGYAMVRGLVQVFDKSGDWVEGFWITGVEYNDSLTEQFVSESAKPYKPPKWWTGPDLSQAPDLHAELDKARQLDEDDVIAASDDLDDDIPIDIPIPTPDEPAVAADTQEPDPAPEPTGEPTEDKPDTAAVAAVDPAKPDPADPSTEPDPAPDDKTADPPKEGGTRAVVTSDRDSAKADDREPDETEVTDTRRIGTETDKTDKTDTVDPGTSDDPSPGPPPPVKGKDKTEPKPKPSRDKSDKSSGVNAPLLSIGGGMLAIGGGLYGVSTGVANGTPSAGYTSADLRNRRTTANALVVSSGALMLGGAGVGITAFVGQTQAGIRLGGRW